MNKMTVADLIALLSEFDQDAEVRIAVQPSYPLQHHISDDIREVKGIVYIAEAGQVYDSPYAPKGVFGDPVEDERCANCGGYDIIGYMTGDPDMPVCQGCYQKDLTPDEQQDVQLN